MTEAAMLTDETDFDFEEETVEEVEMAWRDDLLTEGEFEELNAVLPIVGAAPPKNWTTPLRAVESTERAMLRWRVEGFIGVLRIV